MNSYETPQYSAELLNTLFVDKVSAGQVKEAEENASLFIRTQLYEDGLLRRLFEPRTITSSELDPLDDSDVPSILCEIEPGAVSATFVPFKGTGDRAYFTGKRFRVPFGKVESERIGKSKFELMTIRMPITDWLKENQVKAVQQGEDEVFIETCKDIVDRSAAAAGAISQKLTYAMAGGDFKDAMTQGLKTLNSLRLPTKGSKFLMHKNTYLDSLRLKLDTVGHVGMDKRWENGVEEEDTFLGYPVVTTIKDDIVPENKVYIFAPQEYFCKFFMLQDATLFLKVEADMMNFHTYEAPGFGVGNTKGVVELTLA